ncbi:MAG: holo-ACP synthase [Angelakisella sp.]
MFQVTAGVDSVSIARMEKSMERESFCNRIFSEQEREYFSGKHRPAQSAAGHFAAKEAFLKAMGTGVINMNLRDIGVLHDEQGAPYFVLTDWAAELCGDRELALSITHEDNIAIAFVVAVRQKENTL